MKRPIVMIALVTCVAGLARPSSAAVESGDEPELDVSTIDGESVELDEWRGDAVLIDFWATWCQPCRVSFPFYQDLADEYDEHFHVLAVSVDEDSSSVETFVDQHDITFPVAVDNDHSIASEFEPPTMPTSYLIGPKGEVRSLHEGFEKSDRSELRDEIESLVSEAKESEE